MSAAEMVPQLLSPEEYLAAEELATERHEYLGGVVYAMSGGPIRHSLLASNILGLLYAGLRGRRCRVYNPDMKVRVQSATHFRFYYPDVQVVCQSGPPEQLFQDEPVVIVEVLSDSTRRTDEQEKREAYLSIPSLKVYLLVEQDCAWVTGWRRGVSGFQRESWEGLETSIPLPEVELTLPLGEVYEGVVFPEHPELAEG